MAELGVDLRRAGVAIKDIDRFVEPVTVFHVTPNENINNILDKGLLAGEKKVQSDLREKGNKIIDLYCSVFGVPVNRTNAVYAFLEDPRIVDADNLPYESEKHAVLKIKADPQKIYIADSYHYEGVLAELEVGGLHMINAHVEAIKYVRSLVTLEKYRQSGDKTAWDGLFHKPEVLIPQKVAAENLKLISSGKEWNKS